MIQKRHERAYNTGGGNQSGAGGDWPFLHLTQVLASGRSRRTARLGASLPSLSVGLSESAEPPPICPREHLTADRRSGINRNRGVVARTLVGHLGGGLLTGFGLACSRIKAALCRACRLTSRYTVQPRRDPRAQVYPCSPGDDTVMTTGA